MGDDTGRGGTHVNRRDFLKASLTAAAAGAAVPTDLQATEAPEFRTIDEFDRPDGFDHGDGWESINPGYWMIRGNALRRRLDHRGDQRPGHWFPWHWETHRRQPMPIEYDPSLPFGMIWRRDWKLRGNFAVRIEATVRSLPKIDDQPKHKNRSSGYALMGICFGGQCLHESWTGGGQSGHAAWMAAWRDDHHFGIYDHATDQPKPIIEVRKKDLDPGVNPGDHVTIDLIVSGDDPKTATIRAGFTVRKSTTWIIDQGVDRQKFTDGYVGIVSRGQLDFEVNRFSLSPGDNQPLHAPVNDLIVAYPLGDTLKKVDGHWTCRFITLFRNAGETAEIRIAASAEPDGGWPRVPVAGRAKVVTSDFRRNTAVIEAVLPADPADKTLHYTVFKDGQDVTGDPRIGTDSVGPGTGYIGEALIPGPYIGRLPRLTAPYRLCGLSCHAITGNNPDLPQAGEYQAWWLHDQPTIGALQHIEDYDFQIMVWEDDVWYLELIFPPPSTDDAYKVIAATLGGPTTRRQMMRHWNIINPGDHDHGMDDVKGPEQIILRNLTNLGQDPDYLGRNFQIVDHLISGDEHPSSTDNPKRWRRWKMPAGDFSLLIMDGRLWRSSQDTNIWDDEGWGDKKNIYDRRDPTRSLLGEEQFAWLQQIIRTDASPLICMTGINGLHTIWQGIQKDTDTGFVFNQRDRVAADYAGWVSAGGDRVIDLLGSRPGVVTVYGDVHNGTIMKNTKQRVYECSFGPIGRFGGRSVKEGFGPIMKDYDDRELEIVALYHSRHQTPDLRPITGPRYWNFLEMHFDPRGADPAIELRIRNLIDPPTEPPRGGGQTRTTASRTGRPPTCRLPAVKTLPHADVLLTTTDGTPLRGLRSLDDGTLPIRGLCDVAPNTPIVMTAHVGDQADAKVVVTSPMG